MIWLAGNTYRWRNPWRPAHGVPISLPHMLTKHPQYRHSLREVAARLSAEDGFNITRAGIAKVLRARDAR